MCIVLEKNNAGKCKLLGAASAQISAERGSQGKVMCAALALPLYILTYPWNPKLSYLMLVLAKQNICFFCNIKVLTFNFVQFYIGIN